MSTTCNITLNVAAEALTYPYVGAIKDGSTRGNTFLFLQERQEAGRAIAGKGWREYAEGQTQGVGQYEKTRYIPANGSVTLKTSANSTYPRIGKCEGLTYFSTAPGVWFFLETNWDGTTTLARSSRGDTAMSCSGFKPYPVGTSITFTCKVV